MAIQEDPDIKPTQDSLDEGRRLVRWAQNHDLKVLDQGSDSLGGVGLYLQGKVKGRSVEFTCLNSGLCTVLFTDHAWNPRQVKMDLEEIQQGVDQVEAFLKDPWSLPTTLVAKLTYDSPSAEDLRGLGWSVAVHNDYRLDGKRMTFWLLNRPGFDDELIALKGEGRSDAEALNIIREVIERRHTTD